MKKMTLVILFSIIVNLSFSQEKIDFTKSKTTVLNINSKSKIFDKHSGKQISYNKFNKLVKKYPNLITEVKDEDENGNPTSFYIIKPENKEFLKSRRHDMLPKIKRKDIYDVTFDLESITENLVLVILQLDFHFPAIRVDDLKEAENNAMSNGLTSVILTSSDANTTMSFSKEQGFKSNIIPNALNLIQKIKINRFPVFIITNHKGHILGKTFYSYEIEDIIKDLRKP